MITYLTKSDASEGFDQIIDFLNASSIKYALTVNPNIYVSCIKQFWSSVLVKKVNDVTRLQDLVDRKKVIITEAKIQEALRLDDAESIDCLPNEEIFTELSRMGYEKPSTKLTFYKAFFSPQWNLMRNVDSSTKFYMYPRFLQLMIRAQLGDLSSHSTKYSSPALTQKVFANMRRVGKGFFGVDTPLFEGMIVAQQADDAADEGAADVDDKIAQTLEITKLKQRIKKLERRNKLKVSKLRRLKMVGTAQRVDTSKDIVMDDLLRLKRMQMFRGGKQSQAQIYQIDLEHADKVLSKQDDELELTELKEVVEVVTTVKLMTEVVTAAATITTADTPITAATITTAPNKGKGIMAEEPKPLKKQAQIEQDEAYARELEAELNKIINWDETKEQMEEEDSRALKRASGSQAEKAAKKQKLDDEVEELKKHLQIVPNDEDDVYTEATHLARKVPVVDYEIYTENNKPYYKIIRADGSPQLFLSLLRNFDREDLEMILLVERRYPLTRFTLDQMLNNVRLEVRTSWNEFSSSMASTVICLSTGRKFNFSKYIFYSLMRNVDSSTKFYMYPRFLQLMIRAQLGDLSSHSTKYSSPALTQKVFANMRRVGKGFFGVDTPLFEGMIVAQQADDAADEGAADVDDKIAQTLEITKLKQRIKKLERRNKLKVSKLRRLKMVGTAQRVDTSKDIVMDDLLRLKRMQMFRGGKQSQAQIYQIDLEHADKVLSKQDDELELTELKEVVEVVTTVKLMTEVVTAAATITTADTPITAATITTAPNKGKGIMAEEPKPLKKQAQIEQDEAYARELEAELNKIINWDETKEQMEEEDSRALKRASGSQAEKAAKKQKLDDEVEELKKHLQIVPNDEDDVYTEATHLARKVPVVDYEIYTENNKPYYKIIRADGSPQLFLSLLRNFDREDLEMILLVERRYPLTRFTLDQMLNNVRLEVEEESEVSLELLRFVRQQQQERFRLA
nr:hypothetical protein [Tanacetum cinerariifolium]